MSYEYLVGGISIINDILYSDGKTKKGNLGGCGIFAYGGIGLFTDKVIMISSGGPDYWDYYGSYFDENLIDKQGIYFDLPYTHLTLLKYEEDGKWSEKSLYGDDYFALQSENNRTSYKKLSPFLSEKTKGLYIDSAAQEKIFEEIVMIREKAPNIRIMWEPPTFSSKDPSLHERILDNLKKVDYYSMNLDEAGYFFGCETRQEIIEAIKELNIPCFLRQGEEGSSWIENSECVCAQAYKPDEAIDVTGCGNCSSASALYWRIEGNNSEDIVINSNIAAGYNASSDGPAKIRKGREEKIYLKMKDFYK